MTIDEALKTTAAIMEAGCERCIRDMRAAGALDDAGDELAMRHRLRQLNEHQLRELEVRFRACARGDPDPAPAPPPSFAPIHDAPNTVQ